MMGNLSTLMSIKQPGSGATAGHAHRTICPKKQAIPYANLKMQSNDFSSYLQGKLRRV
jgi:hypothetical protein